MNSRQRVERAVNFQATDRIPVDLGGLRASGINAVAYDRLKRRMGIETPTRVHDTMQMLAEVELEVLDRLGGDVVPLDIVDRPWGQPPVRGVEKRLFCGQKVFVHPEVRISKQLDGSWTLDDSSGRPYAKMPHDGFYFDHVRPTMSGRQIDPKAFQPSPTVPDEDLEYLARRGQWLFENTDKAILGWGAGFSLLGLSFIMIKNITQGSLDEWLCMLMTEKPTAHDMMGRYVDATIERMRLYDQAAGKYCFAWGIASDDAGTQKGELIHPDLFAEMIVPHYRRLCDWAHRNTGRKTFLHSCGSIYHYIGHWIDAGIDILNPVQISAANMDPAGLMEQYGGRVVFWGGGCDTQHILPNGSSNEIAEHVRRNLDIFTARPGGYVFCQVHNIQQNVAVENIVAMYDAVHRYNEKSLKPNEFKN
jgi:uroporphyrinogen decarboxylase